MAAVFLKAALGFLGLSIAPPTASWGSLIKSGYDVVFLRATPVLASVVAVALLTLAVTLIAESLRRRWLSSAADSR